MISDQKPKKRHTKHYKSQDTIQQENIVNNLNLFDLF